MIPTGNILVLFKERGLTFVFSFVLLSICYNILLHSLERCHEYFFHVTVHTSILYASSADQGPSSNRFRNNVDLKMELEVSSKSLLVKSGWRENAIEAEITTFQTFPGLNAYATIFCAARTIWQKRRI
jgi:hypothetical protein